MHERDHQDGRARRSKRRKRMWLATISLILLAIGGWFLWAVVFPRDSRTADERLAEIEAARSIPDSENAAVIYSAVLQDPNAGSPAIPKSVYERTSKRTLHEPWRSRDAPELAVWIAKHQHLMDLLAQAARLESCRFPLRLDPIGPEQKERRAAMVNWADLLSRAANNDVAEGRIDVALTKWQSLLRMGNHLRQYPFWFDHLLAEVSSKFATEALARLIVEDNPAEPTLQAIDALPLALATDLAKHRKEVDTVEYLWGERRRDSLSMRERLSQYYYSYRARSAVRNVANTIPQEPDLDGTICTTCLRHTAAARGVRILVALRRYKNETGCWPRNLDEIGRSLPAESLIDPLHGGAFLYRLTGDTFLLYSAGWNGIDEGGGQRSVRVDDQPIWPPRGRSSESEPRDANDV